MIQQQRTLSRKRDLLSTYPNASKTLPIKKARKVKRSVRFASTFQVVPHRPTSSDDDDTHHNNNNNNNNENDNMNSMWYDNKEYQSFRMRCKQDVIAYARALKAGTGATAGTGARANAGGFDSNEHSVRGLEGYFPPSRKQAVEQRKRQRLHAVLTQQDLQRLAGDKDPQSLACVSGLFSKISRDRALELARRDSMVWFQA